MSLDPRTGNLARLVDLRRRQLDPLLTRVNTQRSLCQRYRNTITGLTRLCGFSAATHTPLQRHNQQQYKATLHRLISRQQVDLQRLEAHLALIEAQLLAAWRSERVLHQLLDARIDEWRLALARQDQRIQDGLASQSWWRERPR